MVLRFHAPEKRTPLCQIHTNCNTECWNFISMPPCWHHCHLPSPLALIVPFFIRATLKMVGALWKMKLEGSPFCQHCWKNIWRIQILLASQKKIWTPPFQKLAILSRMWVCVCVCVRGVGVGGVVIKRFSCLPPNPDARPLGTYETKMVARTRRCSILTILP